MTALNRCSQNRRRHFTGSKMHEQSLTVGALSSSGEFRRLPAVLRLADWRTGLASLGEQWSLPKKRICEDWTRWSGVTQVNYRRQSNYYTFFYRRKLLSAKKLPPKTDGVSENRTHDNDCNIFKFSYFLGSMWSRLFRFFSFVDRVSSHYFCRHPPSQQEVGKLQERKQFLEKNLPIGDPPFPSSLQMVTKFVASFAILTNYK